MTGNTCDLSGSYRLALDSYINTPGQAAGQGKGDPGFACVASGFYTTCTIRPFDHADDFGIAGFPGADVISVCKPCSFQNCCSLIGFLHKPVSRKLNSRC